MTAGSFNLFLVFILVPVFLSVVLHQSHGFEVIQPQNRTVNPDGSASISCEHTANDSSRVEDVRLNVISPTDRPRMLCQKGKKDCRNVTMHQESPHKWLFVLLNVGPEATAATYECEITVNENDYDTQKKGTPTKLLPGQKEAACLPRPSPSPCPRAPHPPQLFWILIGLLALLLLCSCVIASFCIRMRATATMCLSDSPSHFQRSDREAETSTYVEMRKAPQARNPPF